MNRTLKITKKKSVLGLNLLSHYEESVNLQQRMKS